MKNSIKFEWFFVVFLGFGAFILAYVGYHNYFLINQVERNTFDIIYHSIKIFGLDFIDGYLSPVPLTLEIARWLAPSVLMYSAAKGIIYLIRKELSILRIKSYKNHVIVYGINEYSMYLIKNLLDKKEKVVAIAENYEEVNKEIIEREGGLVVAGSISDLGTLKQIAAVKAKYFVFLDFNNENNISSAITISQYSKAKRVRPLLYTHISNYFLMNQLKDINFFNNIDPKFGTDFFNGVRLFSANERTARVLFNKYAPDSFCAMSQSADRTINIILFGGGELTLCLIAQLARMCTYLNFIKTRLTIYYDNDQFISKLNCYFPKIHQLVEVKLIHVDFSAVNNQIIEDQYHTHSFDVIYLTCENDEQTMQVLYSLSKVEFKKKMNTIAVLRNPNGILNKWYSAENIGEIIIHKYDTTSETFTEEAIIASKIDELAKIIHNDYFDKIKSAGKVNPKKESHREWDYLPEDFKNQNRLQADHIWLKLRSINCRAIPLNSAEEEYDFANDKNIVETLSKMEHDRWAAHMIMNGWKYGDKRDDKKKLHTDLIPYEELSEEVKQYDRNTIINIKQLLRQMNLKVVKNNEGVE